MANPWEKYKADMAKAASSGTPWERYKASAEFTVPKQAATQQRRTTEGMTKPDIYALGREILGTLKTSPKTEAGAIASTGDADIDDYLLDISSKATAATEDKRDVGQVGRNLRYVAESGKVGLLEGTEGAVNAGSYLGQLNLRAQDLNNASQTKAWGDLLKLLGITDKVSNVGAQELARAETEASQPLETVARFGDNAAKELSEDYGEQTGAAKLAGDVARGAGQLIPSVVASVITGSPAVGLATSSLSAMGNATTEAKDAGKGDTAALGYGLTVGAIEAVTEKLVGGLGGVFGKGFADTAVSKAVSKVLNGTGGDTLAKAVSSIGGEALEEAISEVAGRIANELIIDTDDRSARQTIKDAAYSALVGGILGGAGDAVSHASFGGRKGAAEAQNLPSAPTSQEIGSDVPALRSAESGENLGVGESTIVNTDPTQQARANAEMLQDQQAALGGLSTDDIAQLIEGDSGTLVGFWYHVDRHTFGPEYEITVTNTATGETTRSGGRSNVERPRIAIARIIMNDVFTHNETAEGTGAGVRGLRNRQVNIDNANPAAYNQTNNGGGADGAQLHRTAGERVRTGRDGTGAYSEMAQRGQLGQGDLRDSGVVLLSEQTRNTLTKRGVVPVEYRSSTDKAAFSFALDRARNADARNGWAVSPQSVEGLAQTETYLSPDGSSGFGIAGGDIVGVFANKSEGAPKGVTKTLMPQAIAAGGDRLDCYGEKLVDIYAGFGFVPVARVEFNAEYANPGYTPDKGTPYVYVMMHNGDSADAVVENMGKYPQYSAEQLNALPTYGKDDYDAAIAYRDSLIEQGKTQRATGAAAAGFTETGEQGFAPTRSQANTNSVWMDEEARSHVDVEPHQVVTERQSMSNASQGFDIDENGRIANYDEAVDNLLDRSDWNGADGDAAQILMAEARRRRDWETFSTLQHRYDQSKSKAGRTLQATKKWIAESGNNIMQEGSRILDGQDNAAETLEQMNELADEFDTLLDSTREVDGLIELIRRTARYRHTAGMFSGELSQTAEWALRHVVERGDIQFLRDLAANGILNIAHDSVAPSAADAARTYRRLSMLSKVSTIMRNLVSNGVFDITDTISRDISVPLDMLLSRFTGTRSVAVDRGIFSQAKRQGSLDGLARSVLEVGLDVDTTGDEGRYETTANRTFHMSGGVASRVLSTWEKYSGYTLQTTDAAARAGTQAEIQRGIDSLYNRGLIRDDSLDNAGQTEGAYRTFQDETSLSRATLGIGNALNNFRIGGENGMGLGDIALPFARTPANLASRSLEYSPLGLIRGSWQLIDVLQAAHDGTLTAAQQAQAVQNIGRGINGSALIAAATALSSAGIIRTLGSGKDDEDADKAAYEKMQGQNGTQINLGAAKRWLSGGSAEWSDGDTLMNIGFLEPLNGQLTTGALIADGILSGEASIGSVLLDSAAGTFKAVLEMPVMSVFADAANAYKYSEGDNAGSKFMDAALQYGASQISSFIPNAVKGLAQGTDKYQRDASTSDNIGGQILDSIKASLPGLRQQLPEKLDSFGKPVENEGGVLGFLNSNILPGAVTRYRSQTGEDVLRNIYELTGSASAYPDRKAPNSITADGEKLELGSGTKREYMQAAGAKHEEYLAAAETSKALNALSTEQQQEVLNELRLGAADAGKAAVMSGMEISELDEARAALRAGDFVTYYSILTAANDVLDGATAQEVSTLEKLLDMGIPASVGKVLEKDSDFSDMLEAYQAGVSVQHYYDYTVVKSQWNNSPAPGCSSAPDWQKYNAINGMNISEEEKLALIGGVNGDFLGKAQEAINQGVSLSDVLAYYEAITARNANGEAKNKAEKNNAMWSLGLDDKTRGILNRIFG